MFWTLRLKNYDYKDDYNSNTSALKIQKKNIYTYTNLIEKPQTQIQ